MGTHAEVDTEVLIAGAGPTGLLLACELARHGVDHQLVEAAVAPSTTSKALALSPRTLEILDEHDLARPAVDAGVTLRRMHFHSRSRRIATVGTGGVRSPFPFVVNLPQPRTEELLARRLVAGGGDVRRGVRVVDLRAPGDAVIAHVEDAGGTSSWLRARWVVGCDGAHSAVRRALGIGFPGTAQEERFGLTDVVLDGAAAPDEVSFFFGSGGLLALAPLPDGSFRLTFDLPPADRATIDLELVRRVVADRGPRDMRVVEARWTDDFRISYRLADTFGVGRCLLAGDAAHIHSPAGGQGMNSGIQDAYNLGWKLAHVLARRADARILDSYTAERRPVAAAVLASSRAMTRTSMLRSRAAVVMRDATMRRLSARGLLDRRLGPRLSQLDLDYGASPIVRASPPLRLRHRALRAGVQVPDARLVYIASGRAVRLLELLTDTRHVLLGLPGTGRDRGMCMVFATVAAAFGDAIARRVLVGSAQVAPMWPSGDELVLREADGFAGRVGLRRPTAVLVRPDGYATYVGPPDAGAVVAQLEVAGLTPNARWSWARTTSAAL